MLTTWYDYRTVWARHPWLAVYAALVVAIFVLSIVGTIFSGPLAILFIPSLAGAYVHHLMVMKRLES